MTKSIHGYFSKSLIASSKNVDDTVLKESARLKDVLFVLFSMLIISNNEHYFETSATFARVKTTYTLQPSVKTKVVCVGTLKLTKSNPF